MVEAGGSKLPNEPTVQVNNDILTVSFDLATQDTSLNDLYAYAHYYEDPNELMMGPKYIDTTADIDNQDPTNGGGSSGDGSSKKDSPGFELILILSAIILISILNYRKRK